MEKMSVSNLIDFIREGKWEIKEESDCYCQFDWEVVGDRLEDKTSSDECWIANVLYVNGESVAQEVQFESREELVELCDYDDTVYDSEEWDLFEILNDLNPKITQNLRMSDFEENETHSEKKLEALIEWLKESDYDLYINPERGFANEYTCILSPKGSDVDDELESVSAQEWAERYLYSGDAATEAFVGFALLD